MWPMMSVSASSTTSLSIRPEPGIDGPPVWMVLWMPYLRAQATIWRAVVAVLDRAEADLAEQLHAGGGQLLEVLLDHAVLDDRRAGHEPSRRRGGRLTKVRCAVMASAFRPTMSRGRPGVCTSPAEIMVVTPPFSVRVDPAELALARRPVAATGCTWLSMRPGASAESFASIVGLALVDVEVLRLADRGDAAVRWRRWCRRRGSACRCRPRAAGRCCG